MVFAEDPSMAVEKTFLSIPFCGPKRQSLMNS